MKELRKNEKLIKLHKFFFFFVIISFSYDHGYTLSIRYPFDIHTRLDMNYKNTNIIT
jgi:hypothetical protein